MAKCEHNHIINDAVATKNINGKDMPHFYVAGICIVDPLNETAYTSFLLANYPCYQSEDYEDSKHYHGELIPMMSAQELSAHTERLLHKWQTN